MPNNNISFHNNEDETVEFEYGTFLSRLGAYIIDNLIIGIPLGIISIYIFIVMLGTNNEIVNILSNPMILENDIELTDAEAFIVLGFLLKYIIFISTISLILTWLYFAFLQSSKWQATLGKKLLSIKVADQKGNRISFGRASGRFFAKTFLSAILFIGYIIAVITDKKQALHDIIAKTIVIKD